MWNNMVNPACYLRQRGWLSSFLCGEDRPGPVVSHLPLLTAYIFTTHAASVNRELQVDRACRCNEETGFRGGMQPVYINGVSFHRLLCSVHLISWKSQQRKTHKSIMSPDRISTSPMKAWIYNLIAAERIVLMMQNHDMPLQTNHCSF